MTVKVWVEVSEQRLTHNLRTIARAASPAQVLAVVKANGYGHGAGRTALALARAGVPWLGVTCADEGACIRLALAAAGIASAGTPRILVMSGSLSEDTRAIVQHRLTATVWTPAQVHALAGTGTPVHIEVETGMARQGVAPGPDLDALLTAIAAANLPLDGLFTHFASAEVADSPLTQAQQRRFAAAVAQVAARGLTPPYLHAANSSAIDNPAHPSAWLCDLAASLATPTAPAPALLVRPGLALYGHTLPIEPSDRSDRATPAPPVLQPNLQPVLTWKTCILALRTLAPGDTVGYGATYTAATPMQVALLPVGYADGLRRELSSTTERPGGWIIVPTPAGPRRAPILGRISMNLTVVDVTGIPNLAAGSEVVLLGDGISAEDHARLARTIPYEILCALRER